MVVSPCRDGIPKVNGSVRMMVMVIVIPGMAPPTTPAAIPAQSERNIRGSKRAKKVLTKRSMNTPQKSRPCGRKTYRYFSKIR